MKYRVIADTSNHNLPIGAIVTKAAPPEWSEFNHWYTQGGDGDEVAIASRDLEQVS